jgi:hypothetical protein
LDGETAQEDERGRREREGTVKRWSGGETEVFTAVNNLLYSVSGLGPESPGNPECPASTPDTPLPLNPVSRFSRNLILKGFGKLLM